MKPLSKLNCIMLVDDDEPTNFIHELAIKQLGCTEHIRIFDYAETAMDYLAHSLDPEEKDPYYQKPDLIFLDINMPRTNAWEFIEEYRKHPANDTMGIIVMMLTTSLNPDDKVKAKAIHEIAGYYNKPLTRQILEEILSTFFPGKIN
jgi:CheY-like chemotaxis protein